MTTADPIESGRISAARPLSDGARALATVVLVILPLALLPILLVAHPPLFDYPNHLSRAHVLADLQEDSPFGHWFAAGGWVLPNVSTDIILVELTRLMGAEQAGRLLLAVIATGLLGGAVALGRIASGRFEPWPAYAAVLLLGEMLHWGFLNYLFGVALLLVALAVHLALRRHRVASTLVAAVFAVLILLSHLVAFGLFAVGLAAIEWMDVMGTPALRPVRDHRRAVLHRFGWIAAAVAPAAVLHLAVSRANDLPFAPMFNYTAFEKLAPFTRLLSAGSPVLDGLELIALVAVLGGFAVTGRIGAHRHLLAVAGAFALCLLVLPYSAMHSFFVDNRIAVAASLVLVAALRTRRRSAETWGWRILVVLVVLRTATVGTAWWQAEAETDAILADLDRLDRGGVLIPATTVPFEYGTGWFYTRTINPPHEHTASWATIRRDAIVPSIFAKRGQNPLIFSPPSRTLKMISLGPIGRVPGIAGRRWLTFHAASVRAQLDRAGFADIPVHVVIVGTTCGYVPPHPLLRQAACGRNHMILEVRPLCLDAPGVATDCLRPGEADRLSIAAWRGRR